MRFCFFVFYFLADLCNTVLFFYLVFLDAQYCSIAQAGLKLVILLAQPFRWVYYRYAPLHLMRSALFIPYIFGTIHQWNYLYLKFLCERVFNYEFNFLNRYGVFSTSSCISWGKCCFLRNLSIPSKLMNLLVLDCW